MTTNTEVRYLFFYVFIVVVLFRHNLTRTCKRRARNPFFGGRGYIFSLEKETDFRYLYNVNFNPPQQAPPDLRMRKYTRRENVTIKITYVDVHYSSLIEYWSSFTKKHPPPLMEIIK